MLFILIYFTSLLTSFFSMLRVRILYRSNYQLTDPNLRTIRLQVEIR